MTTNVFLQPVLDIVERLQVPEPATSLQNEIAERFTADDFTVKGGATFSPRGERFAFSFQVRTRQDFRGGSTIVDDVSIDVYGEMSYRDRSDSGARVSVRHDLVANATRSWTESSAWTGSKYVTMPDGARNAIAAAVVERLGDVDWSTLANEILVNERANQVRKHVGDAVRALQDAEREATRDLVQVTS